MRAGKSYTFLGRKLSDRTCFAWAGNVNSKVYNLVQMPYAAERVEAGSCTNLVALLDNGGTAIMDEYIFTMTYQSNWKYNTLAGAGNARDLWWKREVCLAVTAGGTLLPLNAASASGRNLDFRLAAVTTGANRRGIAAACSGTAPHIADTDGDGALDGWELLLGSSPLDPSGMDADTDSDGMPDWWEKSHGLDPLSAADAPADPDGDGLANLQEFLAGSDPGRRDTDRDGLADRDEVQKYHTDPREVDTDGDGMSDYEECVVYHTDPLVPEPDADRDRIPDGWEVYWGLNPGDPSDASADPDGDGYSNRDEFFTGGKPTSGVPGGRQFCDLLAGGGASGSGGLRVDVLDDNVCSTRQIVPDSLPFGTLADAGYIVNVTVAGRVEDVNAPFDYVSLLSLFGGGTAAEEEFFHGHEGFPDEDRIPDPPPMVDESASRTVLFLSGGSAALQYDTVDARYHRGCYAEVVNAYVEETLRFTFIADLNRDGAAGPDDDVAAEDSAPGLLLGAEDSGGAKLRIGLLPEGLGFGGFRLSVEPSGDGRVEIRDGTGAAVASAGSPRTWTLSSSQPASAVPSDLSVVPLHVSSASGDIVLKLEYLAAGTVVWSDSIVVTVLRVGLIPDWNHDRVIDDDDKDKATASDPFRFWINDDDDFGDISEDDSDVPGQGGLFDNANYEDDEVNGRSDLLDFFPLWLDLHDTLNLLPSSGTVQYKLKQASGAVRAIYSDLTKGQAGNFLTTEGNTYGPSFNQNSYEADTFEVTSSGVTLSTDFLDKIKNDASKGILLMEGAASTTSPLVLEVWKDGAKICETEMPLKVSGVEAFYRWVNLRAAAGGGVSRATDTNEPANNPDAHCNGKHFVFVHGYSVSENAAKGWNAEIFKRLYQAGSRAMFTAVTWFGNEGQVPEWIPWLGGSTPDYYANVVNAFETSSNLTAAVTGLSGTKFITGHSLGNMLVSSALKDNGLSVNSYFMLNAAVAKEAYQGTASDTANMRHPDWQDYDSRLWASEWHQLFGSNDGRNALTWRDRFGAISVAQKYYSSTEDVLDNGDGQLHSPLVSHWAWYNQEVRKGTTLMWLAPGNCEGGWGFNAAYTNADGSYPLVPASANALTDDNIRTNSFFGWFDEDTLYGTNGSAVAQQPAVYRRLLADAIPALSFAMGRNDLSGFGAGAHDLSSFRRGNNPNDWPRANNDWQHSDIKNIAYPFNRAAFDNIVSVGVLK